MNNIRRLHNKFDGERAFLIGNGPSLAETPLYRLESEHTIAMNKINKIYNQTSWRPSIYLLLKEDLPGYLLENYQAGSICITLKQLQDKFGNKNQIYYIKKKQLKTNSGQEAKFHKMSINDIENIDIKKLQKFWKNEIEEFVYSYHTMYAAIQLATYMGFDELYFLGCDLGFEPIDTHMIFDSAVNPRSYGQGLLSYIGDAYQNNEIAASVVNLIAYYILDSWLVRKYEDVVTDIAGSFGLLGDLPYFTSDYRIHPGELDINDELIKSHITAKRILSKKDVKLYNATIGGELEVYPRKSLEELL